MTLTTVDETLDTIVLERVLREAYQRLEIESVVDRLLAKRALRMSVGGTSDGELGRVAGLEVENEGLIKVPVPVGVVEGVVFTTLLP